METKARGLHHLLLSLNLKSPNLSCVMASSHSFQYPLPSYELLQTFSDTQDDWPGPRCGHTLTAVFANNSHQLVLFGGSTTALATEDSSLPGIGLEGVTNSVHTFDVSTRKWTRVNAEGEAPSPRAGHAAASVDDLLFIQGGIGASGPSNGNVYMLDMTSKKLKWHRLVVQGVAPGPRYGHVMILADRCLVIFGGKIGNEILPETWALTLSPLAWQRLNPYGNLPSGRMYASFSAREDGIFLLCGGRDYSGVPLGDSHVLKKDSSGQWVWIHVPCIAPSPRYQHTAVFEGPRLHVIGGVLNKARLLDGEAVAAVLNTETGQWLETDRPETSTSGSNGQNHNQLLRRCRHAAASVGSRIYVYGGLREDVLLDDFLVAEISQPSSPEPEDNPEIYIPVDDEFLVSETSQPSSSEPEIPSFMRRSSSESSMESLAEAYNLPSVETAFYDCQIEGYVPLGQGAETVGNPDGLVRQLSLDRIENESQKAQNASQDLHKKVISTLLRPKEWKPPADREFFLTSSEVESLCRVAEEIFVQEPTVLQLKVPIKVFGDIHGQFGDLMRLFREYGSPSMEGDITHIDYLFLGDFVDRGKHSLETIILLLALKIEYPKNIHLIRGNHESCAMNEVYGFLAECKERMGDYDGLQAWLKIGKLYGNLPLAALVENRILCVHGGIGRAVSVQEIAEIQRPAFPDSGPTVLKDILWSDPTENDTVLGITPNSRGEGVVSFGPDIVDKFCERNGLELIIRAHECVVDGFERFAKGRLITVFSATNYCGIVKNAGAILVIGRDLVIYPKLIHPNPPSISSSEYSPDKAWMQELNIDRPPTPARGQSSA